MALIDILNRNDVKIVAPRKGSLDKHRLDKDLLDDKYNRYVEKLSKMQNKGYGVDFMDKAAFGEAYAKAHHRIAVLREATTDKVQKRRLQQTNIINELVKQSQHFTFDQAKAAYMAENPNAKGTTKEVSDWIKGGYAEAIASTKDLWDYLLEKNNYDYNAAKEEYEMKKDKPWEELSFKDSEEYTCGYCGAILQKDSKVCPICGHPTDNVLINQ